MTLPTALYNIPRMGLVNPKVSVKIPESLHFDVKAEATHRGCFVEKVIEDAVRQYLKRKSGNGKS